MGGGGGGEDQLGYGTLPWWAEGAHRSLIRKAEDFAYGERGSYVPYQDERIAGFTDPELQAQTARQEMFNQGDPSSEFASNQLGLAAGYSPMMADYATREFDTDEMNARMNPFLRGVLDPQLREIRQDYDQQLNRSQGESIARGGAFGTHRSMLNDNQIRANRAQALADATGKGQFDAYNQGLDAFFRDRESAVSGLGAATGAAQGLAGSSSQLGFDAQARQLQNISELERSGATQRELQQRELDLGYADFREEQDNPMQRMSFLSSILSGVPNAQLGGQTITSAQPGLPAQLASLGLGAAGISQLFPGAGA